MNKRKALVTGCCGFIGSHLTRALHQHGWEVEGVDDTRDHRAVVFAAQGDHRRYILGRNLENGLRAQAAGVDADLVEDPPHLGPHVGGLRARRPGVQLGSQVAGDGFSQLRSRRIGHT